MLVCAGHRIRSDRCTLCRNWEDHSCTVQGWDRNPRESYRPAIGYVNAEPWTAHF